MKRSNTTSPYCINSSVAWREVDGKVAIVAPLSQELVILNNSASWLWQLMAEDPMSRLDLQSALMKKFNINKTQAGQDVDAFLGELLEKDLINEVEA